MTVRSKGPGTKFWYVQTDIGIGDITLGEGYDTPFGQTLQLCEISRYGKAERSGPVTDFG